MFILHSSIQTLFLLLPSLACAHAPTLCPSPPSQCFSQSSNIHSHGTKSFLVPPTAPVNHISYDLLPSYSDMSRASAEVKRLLSSSRRLCVLLYHSERFLLLFSIKVNHLHTISWSIHFTMGFIDELTNVYSLMAKICCCDLFELSSETLSLFRAIVREPTIVGRAADPDSFHFTFDVSHAIASNVFSHLNASSSHYHF